MFFHLCTISELIYHNRAITTLLTNRIQVQMTEGNEWIRIFWKSASNYVRTLSKQVKPLSPKLFRIKVTFNQTCQVTVLPLKIINILISGCYRLVTIPLLANNVFKQGIIGKKNSAGVILRTIT